MKSFLNSIGGKITTLFTLVFITIFFLYNYTIGNLIRDGVTSSTEYSLKREVENIRLIFRTFHNSSVNATEGFYDVLRSNFSDGFKLDKKTEIDINGLKTPVIKSGEEVLNLNFKKIDEFYKVAGATATIFVRKGDNFIRVSTSLKNEKGERAIGTYLSFKSPAYQNIMRGVSYVGKAKLFGKDYMTKYAPILDNGEVIGILYIGYEFTLLKKSLEEEINKIKIGESGYPYAFSTKDMVMQIHPKIAGKSVRGRRGEDGKRFFNEMVQRKEGSLFYSWKDSTGEIRDKVATYTYFEEWDWIIVASTYYSEFTGLISTITEIMVYSSIFAITLLSIFLVRKFVSKPLQIFKNGLYSFFDYVNRKECEVEEIKLSSKDELGGMSLVINRQILAI